MKLVDEKGRIFGKVNVIDLALALIVLVLVAGVGYKLFFQKETNILEEVKEEKNADITLYVKGCIPESKEVLKKGDRLIVENEISDIKIVEIKAEDSRMIGVDEKGEATVTTNPLAVDLYITVRAKVEISDGGVILNGEKLKVNMDFQFETVDFFGSAKVTEISYKK